MINKEEIKKIEPSAKEAVKIDLGREIAPFLSSRDMVNYLGQIISNSNKVILDFKNVEFISRSFAHELLNCKMNSEGKIELINPNSSVSRMLETVGSQLNREKSSH